MKQLKYFSIVCLMMMSIIGCGSTKYALIDPEIEAMFKQENAELKLEKAKQKVALALEFHDQGGYAKSAELFLKAADLYHWLGLSADERNSLLAAAKMQLKCSQNKPFLFSVARYKGLIGQSEMPPEDERFLVNLSDHMNGLPLSYPNKNDWRVVFSK